MPPVLHLILLAGCVLVALVALAVCLFFLAFADSPDSNHAAVRALGPAVVYTLVAEAVAGDFICNPPSAGAYVVADLLSGAPPPVLFGVTLSLISRGERRE